MREEKNKCSFNTPLPEQLSRRISDEEGDILPCNYDFHIDDAADSIPDGPRHR
jgi:hypothetical protein